MIKVAPSILSADFANLGAAVRQAENAGAEYVHIDVMDGIFVPNITIGSPVVKCLRKESKLVFDVHLMVEHPETQVKSFAEAGADIITFHIEAVRHAHRVMQQVKDVGCKAGIALNPATPIFMVEELLEDIDMVLLMTVNPGFGGQKFIGSMPNKIKKLRQMVQSRELSCDIEVDGGINAATSKLVQDAGANVLVAGSAIYGAADMDAAIREIRHG